MNRASQSVESLELRVDEVASKAEIAWSTGILHASEESIEIILNVPPSSLSRGNFTHPEITTYQLRKLLIGSYRFPLDSCLLHFPFNWSSFTLTSFLSFLFACPFPFPVLFFCPFDFPCPFVLTFFGSLLILPFHCVAGLLCDYFKTHLTPLLSCI